IASGARPTLFATEPMCMTRLLLTTYTLKYSPESSHFSESRSCQAVAQRVWPGKRANRRSGFWRKDLRLVAIRLSTNRGHHETQPRNLGVCSDNGGDGSRAATAD